MSERRKARRIPVGLSMEAKLTAEGVQSRGRVIDLNNAGAFIATDLTLAKNTLIEVELELPGDEKSVPLRALVARRTEQVEGQSRTIPAGLGLVFLTDNMMERSFIQRAVLEALKGTLEATKVSVGSPREADGDAPA